MGLLPRVLIFLYGPYPFIPMMCMACWSGIGCLCNYDDEGCVRVIELSTLLVKEVVRRGKIEVGEESVNGVAPFRSG